MSRASRRRTRSRRLVPERLEKRMLFAADGLGETTDTDLTIEVSGALQYEGDFAIVHEAHLSHHGNDPEAGGKSAATFITEEHNHQLAQWLMFLEKD